MAATDVGGIVNTNTTWSASGSPYRLTSNVQIAYGATLRIDPGVQVEGAGRNLQAFGSLVVAGTASAEVQFTDVKILGATSNSASAPYSIDIRFARMQGGAFLPPTGNATYGSFSLRDSTLTDLVDYTYVWYPTADCYFERNQFIRTLGLSIGHDGPSVYVRNNLFFQTRARYADLIDPAVQNWNARVGRTVVEFNTFQDLKTYAVALPPGYPNANLIALSNYWGTTTIAEIQTMIFDRNDDLSSAASIAFQPILTAPHAQTPAPLVAPSIASQPVGQSLTVGSSVTLSVTASGSAPLAYQWRKGGTSIQGATNVSLALNNVQLSDAGTYSVVVTNLAGTATSNSAIVNVSLPVFAPSIANQPPSQSVFAGNTVGFSVSASGTTPLSYQWRKDGVAIAGATNATLSFASVQTSDVGAYTVTVSNVAGSVTSNPAILAVTVPNPGRLINLSVLTDIATAGEDFTLGYVVGGGAATGVKPLVIRAAGPSLAAFGVAGPLEDPKLELFAGATKTGENDNWGGFAPLSAALSAVGAFAFTGATSRDAALTANITTRDNSVKVSAVGSGIGKVMAEIYDATPASSFTTATPRLINVSLRKHLGAGLSAGFVVGGATPVRILVRAIGPTLASFGVPGVVLDPQLALFNASSVKIGESNDWLGTTELTAAFAAVGAFALPATSKDAALLVALPPGNYSVQVSGVNLTTGQALVEVYEMP